MAMTAKKRKNRSGGWDLNQFISFGRMQMNRVGPVCGKYPSTSVLIQAVPLRKCKKNEKKACQAFPSPINREPRRQKGLIRRSKKL
jgi:hypothetical protein